MEVEQATKTQFSFLAGETADFLIFERLLSAKSGFISSLRAVLGFPAKSDDGRECGVKEL